MVKLRLNSCDEVCHGAVRYPVSNSTTALDIGEVDVPPEVAAILLSVSAGATLAEPEPPTEPSGEMIRVRHFTDPNASFSWQGQPYEPDENGVIACPAAALPGILSHGFRPIAGQP